MTAVEKRRWLERWSAKNIARVEHPGYGLLIVPCENNYAARMCAAEVWGLSEREIPRMRCTAPEPGDVAIRRA